MEKRWDNESNEEERKWKSKPKNNEQTITNNKENNKNNENNENDEEQHKAINKWRTKNNKE